MKNSKLLCDIFYLSISGSYNNQVNIDHIILHQHGPNIDYIWFHRNYFGMSIFLGHHNLDATILVHGIYMLQINVKTTKILRNKEYFNKTYADKKDNQSSQENILNICHRYMFHCNLHLPSESQTWLADVPGLQSQARNNSNLKYATNVRFL